MSSSTGNSEPLHVLTLSSGAPGTVPAGDAARRVTRSGLDSDAPTLVVPRGTALPELSPPLAPGDLGACGSHRVLRLLGRGGMGAVFEALDTDLNRRVALKLMLPGLAASAGGRERFLREARAAAAVHHENVVRVYAVGSDAGAPFLTMELLRGDHLGHRIEHGVPLADVIRIGREVALGLSAAHALGVVHRDIKPANIWIEEPHGRVRLLDFGLARVSDEVNALGPARPTGAPDLTHDGALIGTPMYMSPEQVRGEPVDARSDLFSLGAVLYQMVTGRGPFAGPTVFEVTAAICRGAFVPVPDLVPGAHPALVRLIHGLLAVDPARRPASAAVVADELLAIGTSLLLSAGSAGVAVPLAPVPPPPFEFDGSAPPVPRRRIESPAVLLLGTATAIVAGFLGLGTFHRLTRPTAVGPPPPAAAVPLAPPKPAVRFAPLFNGRDLAGWHPAPGQSADSWGVRDGLIVVTPKPGDDQVLLTDTEYADFELRFEYRWPKPGGHTVVLLRAPNHPQAVGLGLALNLGDDEGFPAVHGRVIGGLYRTGLFQGVTFNPPAANRPIGQWNEVTVTAKRQTVSVAVNRIAMPTADLGATVAPAGRTEAARPAGSIGLVCHWGAIEFRNLAVRPVSE